MAIDEPIDEIYERTFDQTVTFLHERLANEPELGVRDLERTLESLYVRHGNNWTGRGQIRDRIDSAVIAAHERVVAELSEKARAGGEREDSG